MEDWLAAQPTLAQCAPTHPQDPGFWLFSSGSTGRPKATVHSHANPYWTAKLYGQDVLALHAGDVCFSAAKLFFAYGLGNALTFPLSVGATTVLMAERPTPDAVFHITWFGCWTIGFIFVRRHAASEWGMAATFCNWWLCRVNRMVDS